MRALSRYQPSTFEATVDLDLSRNETWPMSGLVDALRSMRPTDLSNYPTTTALRRQLADHFAVGPERVVVTAGGDDALARCFLANRGRPVATTTPTFEMIGRYADQCGSKLTEISWWDGSFPRAELLTAGESASMVVVVSPNNPTGSVISREDLLALSSGCALVVLDGAYTEFADRDLTGTAIGLDNVVMIRTFSKAYGLAGLRVGYMLGPEDLIAGLSAYGSPYAVTTPSARLATEALRRSDDIPSRIQHLRRRRERLVQEMARLGLGPLPSQGNFVLATNVDSSWLRDAAAGLGVGVRTFPGGDLTNCVRITVPDSDENTERLCRTLRTIMSPEALILDLDGVIADVSRSYRRAIVETAEFYGVTVTPQEIATAKAAGNANDDWELTHRLCLAKGVDVSFEDVVDRFETLYQGGNGSDGLKRTEKPIIAPDLLERLSRSYSLGVVTGRPRRDADEFLDRWEIAGLFDAVVTREDAPGKPDPAPVLAAMERMGVHTAWMAGDTPDDVEAARSAGVLPIGIVAPGEDPNTTRKTLAAAAVVLGSLNELEEMLDVQTR